MDERRQHQRVNKNARFYCFIGGEKFDASSLDVSYGGAFMETELDIKPGTVVMIVPGRDLKKKMAVVLAGAVVRRQENPKRGVGIKWLKCVTRQGMQHVYGFLAAYLDILPAKLPLPSPDVLASPSVSFDFASGTFSALAAAPTVTQAVAVARPQPAAPLPTQAPAPAVSPTGGGVPPAPPTGRGSAASPPLAAPPPPAAPPPLAVTRPVGLVARPPREDRIMGNVADSAARLTVNIPVQLMVGDEILEGTVRVLSARAMFVSVAPLPGAAPETAVVAFPIPMRTERVQVYVTCAVASAERGASQDSSGYQLDVRAVRDEPSPGVFERYVRFLQCRSVAAA